MPRILFFVSLLVLSLTGFGQFSDDFSDEDFTQNPAWMGNTEKFAVQNGQLRLVDNQPGQAYLATPSYVINNTQWEFWLRLAFTPSNNNHPRIYLVSDSPDLSGPLNGYYMRIGKDGGDNKRIYFYRQTGDISVELMAGNTNLATGSNNLLRIKTTRDDQGNWEFLADRSGNNLFLPEGSVSDNQHTTAGWFGVRCFYTISNSDRFYFDDFYVGDIIVDNTPPEVQFVNVTGANTLEVNFSEPVESLSAQNNLNYHVDKGLGNPIQAVIPSGFPSKVNLTFADEFVNAEIYTLSISNVEDYSGNTMELWQGPFALYRPTRFDVVFNEIMANPAPEVGLPSHEYVELYNTTGFEINLEGWTLQHGTTQIQIPSALIQPGEYLVLTTSQGFAELSSYGNVVAVPGLSTTALTNAGATLILFDKNMEMISTVSYSDQWYRDAQKASGGWALEKIDPLNYCGEAGNWRASVDPRGGSPGEVNSVRDDNPDIHPPILLSAVYENPLEISLYFSEPMDEFSLSDPSAYTINGMNPMAVAPSEPDFKKVSLILSQPLEENVIYQMVLENSITDCAGNPLANLTASFANYTAGRHDVVFNELMANPSPVVGLPPQKYLEFYNTSEFPINLRGWTLTHGTTQRSLPVIDIPPKGFAVITNESGISYLAVFDNVAAVPGLSVNFLTIGGLTLTLRNPQGHLISTVSYSESWYRDASKTAGGWSLEKIDPYNFCGGADNWRASTDERGGTPGKVNSVRADNPDNKPPVILRAGFIDNNTISVFFDETMDEETLSNAENYSINNGIGRPVKATPILPDFRKVELSLAYELAAGIIYEINISNLITDCAGNSAEKPVARVAVPEAADSLDLVINEILFNPPDRGVRYIEIYNRSQKTIELQNYIISSKDTIENILTTVRDISSESQLIFPGDYRVLTPDPRVVQSQFMTNNPLGFIVTAMPSMTNTRGILVLASKGQRIIDMFRYEEDMHYALLTTKKGVALERLNYNRPTQDRSNWHSAAQNVGFGTPGYLNSQFTLDPGAQEEVIEIYPEIFSPDNDGVDDVLNISYRFESPGYTANVNIYDSRGRLVRKLSRSELLSAQGVITWDGTTDQNLKAGIGIYVIYMEVFDPQGNVRSYRKSAVLGGRL